MARFYYRRFSYQRERQWRKKSHYHSAKYTSEDRSGLITLIKSCSSESHLRQVYARILVTSAGRDAAVTAAFLSTAAAHPKLLPHLLLVFERIPKPFTPHYNALIRSFSLSSSPENSFFLFRDMRRRQIMADPVSFTFVLKACNQIRHHCIAELLHGGIIRSGHLSDSLLLTTLMDFYASRGNITYAEHLFDEMPHRDLVSWNVLLSCYTENGRSKDAISLFDLMQEEGYNMEPDKVTCLILIQACSNLGALHSGERIHRYLESRGYGATTNIRNSLITMYSKCGAMEKAFSLFREAPSKDVISWSAIISGLAFNGKGREALEAFYQMQREGIAPDEKTLTCILSACSHGGMVTQGLEIFKSISSELGLNPNLHHFGCTVDLLGRAGMVDRAYDLIVNTMEINTDANLWRTLLGACRIHRRIKIGELASRQLAAIEPQEGGDCALMLNIYASKGEWEKVRQVRMEMKEKKLETRPGCSSIEVSGQVHEFNVDEISHVRTREIYEILEALTFQTEEISEL